MVRWQREYIVLTAKLWAKNISGPVFAIIGLVLAAMQQFSRESPLAAKALAWGAGVTLAAAVLMVFVAQYQVWEAERQRREEEAAKNVRPEIQGEAFHFCRHGIFGEGPGPNGWSANLGIQADLYVTNVHPVTTNIRTIHLDGSGLSPAAEFSRITLLAAPGALEHGIGWHFQLTADATFPGKKLEEIGLVDLARLKVRLVDGFGTEHRISIRPGETLSDRYE